VHCPQWVQWVHCPQWAQCAALPGIAGIA